MNEFQTSTAAAHRRPLVSVLWPTDSGAYSALRAVFLVVAGTALLALSAKVNVPLPYVPMTMQTLVVLMIGACYGSVLGAATLLAYLAEGAIGLPVFAGPVGGLAYMMGPTGGYMLGFVIAAYAAGWLCERGWDVPASRMLAVMFVGHAIILGFGFAWLAFGLNFGVEKSWLVGVVPFIAGSVVKSALGTALLYTTRKIADRTQS